MEIERINVSIPEGANVIAGQTHFIKTVEDLYEVFTNSVPGIKFGLAFCEASGKCLIRADGTDDELVVYSSPERGVRALAALVSYQQHCAARGYPQARRDAADAAS